MSLYPPLECKRHESRKFVFLHCFIHHHLDWCLANSRQSINICWINKSQSYVIPLPKKQCIFAVCVVHLLNPIWILVSILTTLLKITFLRSPVKSQLQYLKESLSCQTSPLFLTLVISPVCETPFCWSLWHFALLSNFKVSDCSFSVSFSTTLKATVPLGWVLRPLLLWYSALFGCPHPLSWSLPSPTGWQSPNL